MVDQRKRVVWAPRAKRDLREIWSYYARIASLEVADGLLRDSNRAGARLAGHPFMGRPRNELVAGLRSILVHPYIVFYGYRASRWKLPEFYISDATWRRRSRGGETTPRGSVEVEKAT